MRVWWLFITN